MAKPDATVYVRLEQMQRYMSGWSGCNGICPAGADATVYSMSGWSGCNGICPAGADATVYVRLERMQRYMSGWSGCNGICPAFVYTCLAQIYTVVSAPTVQQ